MWVAHVTERGMCMYVSEMCERGVHTCACTHISVYFRMSLQVVAAFWGC